MNERTKQALHALAAALLLGALGDALLRATPWGLNLFLWVGAVVAVVVLLLSRWRRAALRGAGGGLLLPVVLSAAAFAWRDSGTLLWLDALGLMCALGLLVWRARGASLRLAGLSDYARGLAYAGAQTLVGSLPLVITDVRWRDIPRGNWTRHTFAALRGLLVAVPLLGLFGALFAAADAVFAQFVNRAFNFDPGLLVTHACVFALCAWVAAGYLRGLLLSVAPPVEAAHVNTSATTQTAQPNDAAQSAQPTATQTAQPSATPTARPAGPPFALGAVEIGVVIGLLDALFLGFVCVQVHYLFGGAAWVAATGGLTYAEYARRGFFELVWAAALVLPLLLALHALLRAGDRRAERLFRALALAQIALLFVVIASAVTRMRLYQREYGLTELRLYTTAFMGWLALVFVWFAATVLRGARARFAAGALVSAGLIVGALHLLNPDDAIVRANAAHARAGRAFDARYAVTLSADAVPALVRTLPALGEAERCYAARRLLELWARPTDEDWRSWNLARSRARRAVADQEETLRAWACAPPAAPSIPIEPPPASTPDTPSAAPSTNAPPRPQDAVPAATHPANALPSTQPTAQAQSAATSGQSAMPAQSMTMQPASRANAPARPKANQKAKASAHKRKRPARRGRAKR
ncbi:MAG TPA: DUF4153 domain-containing protein [Pyrinomonadaceae bacterium]|jgi:hypothetical protein